MNRPHTAKDCDETCRSCIHCYVKTGDTVCSRTCEHKDTNHPPEDDEE